MGELTSVEVAFVARWQRMNFSKWNEQEVREGFIIRLMDVLGYRKGTTYDIEMEKKLKLSEPFHRIGRKTVAIDYAPSLRLRYFWIVEAKPGAPKGMKFGDVLQAHLYAIHPEVQARFIVLCNGWEVRVYDALTLRSFDDALHVTRRDDAPKTFSELQQMLGAEHMLSFQRKRLIDLTRDTLKVEVDEERFRKFEADMKLLLREGETLVRENAQALRSKFFQEWFATERQELRKMTCDELFVHMDTPEDGRQPPAEEYLRRIREAPENERPALVDALWVHSLGRPHNVFRIQALHVLVRLLELGVSVSPGKNVSSIRETLERLSRGNISYCEGSPIQKPLRHLDNVAMRVSSKFCKRLGMELLTELTKDMACAMTAEERVAEGPSVPGMMVKAMGHMQEVLWRKYCSGTPTDVWNGVWNLQHIEKELEAIPEKAYPGGDFDLLFFEIQGVGWDQLRGGTWNILSRRIDLLRAAGVAPDILEFASLERETMRKAMPIEPPPQTDWIPTLGFKEFAEDLFPKVVGLRVLAVLARFEQRSDS